MNQITSKQDQSRSSGQPQKKRLNIDKCDVCQDKLARYRCTSCDIVSCSLACKNTHACGVQDQIPPKEKESTIDEHKPMKDVDDEIKVPKRTLQKLKNSSKIKEKLKSKKLQELVKLIDSSDKKLKLLDNEMKYNTEFFEFAIDILKELGYVDENGQFLM